MNEPVVIAGYCVVFQRESALERLDPPTLGQLFEASDGRYGHIVDAATGHRFRPATRREQEAAAGGMLAFHFSGRIQMCVVSTPAIAGEANKTDEK